MGQHLSKIRTEVFPLFLSTNRKLLITGSFKLILYIYSSHT